MGSDAQQFAIRFNERDTDVALRLASYEFTSCPDASVRSERRTNIKFVYET